MSATGGLRSEGQSFFQRGWTSAFRQKRFDIFFGFVDLLVENVAQPNLIVEFEGDDRIDEGIKGNQ
ncbi:MAG: hypothetical protein ACP5D7_13555 [Limnospira sp.]